MKIKTSITLTDTLVADMDKVCGGVGQRSAFVEAAIRSKLDDLARQRRNEKDLAIINARAAALNEEAEDCLDWQTI